MATTPRAAENAIGQIERAHRQFKLGALQKLYPSLTGQRLARAMGREHLRDGAYVTNMKGRLVGGVRAIQSNANLSPAERSQRIANLIRSEHRYLAMHIEAAGWRMQSEADMSALKDAGETGAVWKMDPTKRNHTADCKAMDARFWKWDVLDRINPANRHAGCGCRLISKADAVGQGISFTAGRRHAAIKDEMAASSSLTEALTHEDSTAVPIFGHNHLTGEVWDESKHPRIPNGRFVRVEGTLPAHMQGNLHAFNAAVAAGNLTDAQHHHALLVKQAAATPVPQKPKKGASQREKDKYNRAHQERKGRRQTVRALMAAVTNPSGARLPTGAMVRVGDQMVPNATAPASGGTTEPWTKDDTFAWHLPKGKIGKQTAERLSRGPHFEVTETRDGYFVQTKPGLPELEALPAARMIEQQAPILRGLRASSPGVPLHDALPLNLDDREPRLDRGQESSAVPGVTDHQFGLAAEAGALDVFQRLKDLGVIAPDDTRFLVPAAHGDSQAPLDMYLGGLGVESKASPKRDMDLDEPDVTPSIDKDQAPRKRAALRGMVLRKGETKAKPATGAVRDLFDQVAGTQTMPNGAPAAGHLPAALRGYVDTENGTVDYFLHRYPDEETAFRSFPRVPVAMRKALAEGRLLPGHVYAPDGGRNRDLDRGTMFVGTFPLRYDPTTTDVGTVPTAAELAERIERGGPHPGVDVGVPTGPQKVVVVRKVKSPAKAKAAERNDGLTAHQRKALELKTQLLDLDARGLTQGEIGRQIGVTKSTISRYFSTLAAMGIGASPGAGARTDLKRRGAADTQHRG